MVRCILLKRKDEYYVVKHKLSRNFKGKEVNVSKNTTVALVSYSFNGSETSAALSFDVFEKHSELYGQKSPGRKCFPKTIESSTLVKAHFLYFSVPITFLKLLRGDALAHVFFSFQICNYFIKQPLN